MHDDDMTGERTADDRPSGGPADENAQNPEVTPRPRSSIGSWLSSYRVVTLFIAIHVVVYLAALPSGGIAGPFESRLFLDQRLVSAEPWTLLTALFVQVNVFSLVAAVFSLFSAGPFLERVLGHSRFAAVYLIGGLAGSVLTVLTNTGPVAGAGPATLAMLGAIVVVYVKLRAPLGRLLQLVGVNLIINLLIVGTGGGLGWVGTLGGLVIGGLVSYIVAQRPARAHPDRQIALVVLVLLVLLGLVAAKILV